MEQGDLVRRTPADSDSLLPSSSAIRKQSTDLC